MSGLRRLYTRSDWLSLLFLVKLWSRVTSDAVEHLNCPARLERSPRAEQGQVGHRRMLFSLEYAKCLVPALAGRGGGIQALDWQHPVRIEVGQERLLVGVSTCQSKR